MSRIALCLGLTAFGIAACTIASPTHITVQPTKTTDATDPKKDTSATEPAGEASGGDAVTCDADDFVTPDVDTLTACAGGHCYPRTKTPMAEEMIACPDGDSVCVPDEILTAAGGTLVPCSVQALGGAAGACVTASLFPTIVSQGGDALKKDVCNDGQLCVPCTDPTHGNAPTPFCQPIGVHDADCEGDPAGTATPDAAPPPTELCCTTDGASNGICIDQDAIPVEKVSKTIKDTCHRAKDRCVPRAQVEGNPVTCDSGLGGKGICLDKCFNKLMGTAGSIGALKQASCGDTELCVPCLAAGSDVPGCK